MLEPSSVSEYFLFLVSFFFFFSFGQIFLVTDHCVIFLFLYQKKSLAMFQHDSSCMALVMDGSAALGLDLSFVTHVFLMEPIWDRR